MSRPASLLKLEQDAYYAVLRALAVNELDWTKEKLLTDLRKVLNITNDQHFQFLEEVMEDKLVLRLQESRAAGPPAAAAGAAPAAAPAPAALPPVYDMPPPPRQAATPAVPQRKLARPASANLKAHNSVTPPLGPRASRLSEPAISGDTRRRHVKRERDEGFDPKRAGSAAPKAQAGGRVRDRTRERDRNRDRNRNRNRNRGGAAAAAAVVVRPEPIPPAVSYAEAGKRYKVLPFAAGFLAQKVAAGNMAELEEMQAALVAQEAALQGHLDLLLQLEDDTLVAKDPARFCQLLIQELEATEVHLSTEIEGLRSDDEMLV